MEPVLCSSACSDVHTAVEPKIVSPKPLTMEEECKHKLTQLDGDLTVTRAELKIVREEVNVNRRRMILDVSHVNRSIQEAKDLLHAYERRQDKYNQIMSVCLIALCVMKMLF